MVISQNPPAPQRRCYGNGRRWSTLGGAGRQKERTWHGSPTNLLFSSSFSAVPEESRHFLPLAERKNLTFQISNRSTGQPRSRDPIPLETLLRVNPVTTEFQGLVDFCWFLQLGEITHNPLVMLRFSSVYCQREIYRRTCVCCLTFVCPRSSRS